MGFEEEEENEAGPSVPYAERQAKALGILASSEALECCSCRDHFGLNSVVRLDCMDLYCIDCLKGLFMQSIKDFSLFPPRCCGKHIPLALITKQLAVEELDDFHLAEAEFESRDKTYCSNAECGRFIPPTRIRADRGECDRCGADTCTLCKNAFHTNDCPADPALQATLDLAAHQGWRRCFACRALVEISTGCNHMTCKCGAQFCYICGEPWRSCRCSFWDENNLLQRAEEVVERNAMGPLPQHERRRRVNEMRDELREDHDCEQGHSRRFERVNNYTRRGMECELCGARHWKYLLECRRCHIAVCEVCRRNRV
ncbi:ariadne RING finger [Delitschia confertaspora ATCC 74209]|uniref:RBR-type E3 ubiquitin transferase n=1 Tax=Delitschia confertaspora ATCC 74209 TaxID=1513339 RepID=A0A9P4MNK5_9PLEO|nr:ariadne RING finger [Delitschia confertaspora ATCC 74209]